MEKRTLERLEERTQQAVKALQSLRRDNQRMEEELQSLRGDSLTPGQEELDLLREERESVRERVENLVRILEESL